jgi:hypothetical protein
MISSRPKEDWQVKLDDVVEELARSNTQPGRKEFDLNRIRRLVGPPSQEELAFELTRRVMSGELSAIYRVLSPDTRSSIAEYDKLSDVPTEVYDETMDRRVHVEPYRDVELVYSGPTKAPAASKG